MKALEALQRSLSIILEATPGNVREVVATAGALHALADELGNEQLACQTRELLKRYDG